MPGHPDDDVLADLAADVLPAGEARSVEAHVMACAQCAQVLEDAEHVRGLLLAGDPGPVPADVWQRIEAALPAEGGAAAGTGTPPTTTVPLADTAAFQAFVDAPPPPGRVLPLPSAPAQAEQVEQGGAGWADDADPLDDPGRWSGSRRPRTTPASRSTARRDARPVAGRRRGPVLLAAAAGVAVIAVVGAVKIAAPSGSDSNASLAAAEGSAASSTAGGGAAPASAAAPLVRSGVNYTASTLAEQASALVHGDTGQSQQEPRSTLPRRSVTGGDLGSAVKVKPDTAAGDVRNPSRLAACLATLDLARDRVVAVDLATYEGREAAILVLEPPTGGGYEVWAVERTCGSGVGGALKYTRLPG